jgi:hypothetical protein
MNTNWTIFLLSLAMLSLIHRPAKATSGTASVVLRPKYVCLKADTSQSAVLVNLSGYSTDQARFRLFKASSQYWCWDNATSAFITSTSYSSAAQATGSLSVSSTFWIIYERGTNISDSATYRDRLGPGYTVNNNSFSLPQATPISDSYSIQGSLSGSDSYTLAKKYVVMAWEANTLLSVSSSKINSGYYNLELPAGSSADRIEIRTIDNNTAGSIRGNWSNPTTSLEIQLIEDPVKDAGLKSISINGKSVPEFNVGILNYNLELSPSDSLVPTVSALAINPEATVNVFPATGLTGDPESRTTMIRVVSADGSVSKIYSVIFSLAAVDSRAALSEIFLDGVPLKGFVSWNKNYEITVPENDREVPLVTYTPSDNSSFVEITEAVNTSGDITERTTVIYVTSADQQVSNTYRLVFNQYQPSDNEKLSDIFIDGIPLDRFNSDSLIYTISLPAGATNIPLITCATADLKASVTVSEATGLTGPDSTRTTKLFVTAEDNVHRRIYSITFSLEVPSTDASLSGILVDFSSLAEFRPDVYKYQVLLPAGTSEIPLTTVILSDQAASALITEATDLTGNETERSTVIEITAEDGIHMQVYSISFYINVPEHDASLSGIYIDGFPLADFQPEVTAYNMVLPFGSKKVPSVSCSFSGSKASSIITDAAGLSGSETDRTTFIGVTAEDGTVRTYSVIFSIYKPSGDASLSGISIDGSNLAGFSGNNFKYAFILPAGTTGIPLLAFLTNDSKASGIIIDARSLTGSRSERTSEISVTAEDGITKKSYFIVFSIAAPSHNASISGISVNGNPLAGFSPGNLNYSCILQENASQEVSIAITKASEKVQTIIKNPINISGTRSERTGTVEVTAEDGVTRRVYSVVFSTMVPSDEAFLKGIYINGVPVSGFSHGNMLYAVLLPAGTTEIPEISCVPADPNSSVIIKNASGLNGSRIQRTASITVKSVSGKITKIYSVIFKVYSLSSNSLLNKIFINGNPLTGFSQNNYTYSYGLTDGITEIPEIQVIPADLKSVIILTGPANLSGTEAERTAQIFVTAEDGTHSNTYTIIFYTGNPTGRISLTNNELRIYPVPATDRITVEGFTTETSIDILDLTGTTVNTVPVSGNSITVDISGLVPGIYFVKSQSRVLEFVKN